MPALKKYIIPVLVIFFSVFAMRCCRIAPASTFFNGYDILYVTNKIPAKNVMEILRENNCENVISAENQETPLNMGKNSPEVALANSKLEKSTYLKDRMGFFSDKEKKNNVFYIPAGQKEKAMLAAGELSENGYSAGINARAKFPFASIAVVILFSAFLVFFSENRILCALAFVFPVIFSVSLPFSAVSAGLCLFELFLFFCIKFHGREKSAERILRNVMLLTLLGASFICLVLAKIQAGIFFAAMILSEISLAELYKNINEKIDGRYSFNPVKIRSAFSIRLFTRKGRTALAICAFSVLAIFAAAMFSSNFSSVMKSGNNSAVQLPSGKAAVSALPGIGNFIEWKWDALTFPYRSLNDKNRKNARNDAVFFKNFQEKDGVIQETVSSLYYNEDFKTEALNEIEKLEYPALEKMLAKQGKNAKFGYAAAGLQNITLIMIIVFIIAFLVPLSFYLTSRNKAQEIK